MSFAVRFNLTLRALVWTGIDWHSVLLYFIADCLGDQEQVIFSLPEHVISLSHPQKLTSV